MDKLQKVRAEIERQYNYYLNKDGVVAAEKSDVLKSILSFIDSLPEYPVSEPIDIEHELYVMQKAMFEIAKAINEYRGKEISTIEKIREIIVDNSFDCMESRGELPMKEEPKPKFKVGDTIRSIAHGYTYKIVNIGSGWYVTNFLSTVPFKDQDYFELVEDSDKLTHPKVTKTSDQEPASETEMPFGAKDSEFMEATYFIPEGCHAEIVGNKVVIKQGAEIENLDLEKEIHSEVTKLHTAPCYDELAAFARHFTKWMKQQLVKDAVDGVVSFKAGDCGEVRTSIGYLVPKELHYGDKVKLIIIKENGL